MTNLVWESKLDNIYQCEVTRLSHYKGLLKITNTKNNAVLLEQEVSLSYGAQFGPDFADVAEWQDLIIQTVDNQ